MFGINYTSYFRLLYLWRCAWGSWPWPSPTDPGVASAAPKGAGLKSRATGASAAVTGPANPRPEGGIPAAFLGDATPAEDCLEDVMEAWTPCPEDTSPAEAASTSWEETLEAASTVIREEDLNLNPTPIAIRFLFHDWHFCVSWESWVYWVF